MHTRTHKLSLRSVSRVPVFACDQFVYCVRGDCSLERSCCLLSITWYAFNCLGKRTTVLLFFSLSLSSVWCNVTLSPSLSCLQTNALAAQAKATLFSSCSHSTHLTTSYARFAFLSPPLVGSSLCRECLLWSSLNEQSTTLSSLAFLYLNKSIYLLPIYRSLGVFTLWQAVFLHSLYLFKCLHPLCVHFTLRPAHLSFLMSHERSPIVVSSNLCASCHRCLLSTFIHLHHTCSTRNFCLLVTVREWENSLLVIRYTFYSTHPSLSLLSSSAFFLCFLLMLSSYAFFLCFLFRSLPGLFYQTSSSSSTHLVLSVQPSQQSLAS